MKKIFFALTALVCSISMQAQIVKLYKDNTLVGKYTNSEVTRIKFMNESDKEPVSGITLSSSSLTVLKGKISHLGVGIDPSDAYNQSVSWSSSNTSIATVANGVVTGVKSGTATITCTASDGSGVKATCKVTVFEPTYVDLGLPSGTLWATCNLGATTAEGSGLYFAWGETTGYTSDTNDGRSFDWSNYEFGDYYSSTLTKYCLSKYNGTVDNKQTLDLEDDAAYVNWGSNWRMPTATEINELINKCTWTATTKNGVSGYNVTGTNGNSIFLPIVGERLGSSYIEATSSDDWLNYWSSSLGSRDDFASTSLSPMGLEDGLESVDCTRCYGLCIRPVHQ